MLTRYEIVARLLKENNITAQEAALLLEKEVIYQYIQQPQPIQIQPYNPLQYPYTVCYNPGETTSNSGGCTLTSKSN